MVIVDHFGTLFKEHEGNFISSHTKILLWYPSLLFNEKEQRFGASVSSKEIEKILKLFSKYKILGADRWIIDFFLNSLAYG